GQAPTLRIPHTIGIPQGSLPVTTDNRTKISVGEELKAYQMSEIALYTIDQVAIAMDFDTGAGHRQVVDRVQQFARQQAPARPAEEHARVATWVLESLINTGDLERTFRHDYGFFDADGVYQVLTWHFKLIEERRDAEGRLYLRASNEALNVLVGALDTDVESAQVAAEVKLDNLIRRGRLADAKLVAEQARIRTIQYGEQIRAHLDATRRNIQAVDWLEKIPDLIDQSLAHIQERVRAEQAIAQSMRDARDEADDGDRKSQAAELVEIVEDCIVRHGRLQGRIMDAHDVFREEQDRQQFSPQPQRAALDLHGQLLRPLLDLPITQALQPAGRFFAQSAGPDLPDLLDLAALVTLLLRPTPQRARFAGEVPDVDTQPSPEHRRFSSQLWQQAEELLHRPGAARTLSSLLDEAAALDPELPHLVALLGVDAHGPQPHAALRRREEHIVLAVPADTTFDTQGFHGDELLITTARLTRTPDTAHAAGSPGPTHTDPTDGSTQ
ncbi:hypothetical protein, partial [Kitasatospora sp. NPDC005751]|uniref:hypothetical protein n=1 Tax=Kitasatospora sp. NPDC005751 TaxID=3157064 RepID=UPI0033E4731C